MKEGRGGGEGGSNWPFPPGKTAFKEPSLIRVKLKDLILFKTNLEPIYKETREIKSANGDKKST